MNSRDILELKQENLVIDGVCGVKKRDIKGIFWKDVSAIYRDVETVEDARSSLGCVAH